MVNTFKIHLILALCQKPTFFKIHEQKTVSPLPFLIEFLIAHDVVPAFAHQHLASVPDVRTWYEYMFLLRNSPRRFLKKITRNFRVSKYVPF